MPLVSGTRVGPYEVLEPLGAGGMGEVYKARDPKLGREVAIKVLPPALSQDPDRLSRFEREARVLASLNHPNIAQIYAVEDGALVMEFVEGTTLAGTLPVDTALDYARQIAEALEAAHEKGIIHRDLKPGNIMIAPGGIVKVLDFGLASAPRSDITSNPENSPTLTLAATQGGVILGTPAYVSPEQAAGKPVDKRSDIWSFGVVLWEMLTGKRLFEGDTATHTLAGVLKDPIDFGSLPKTTPPAIRVLLERCLDRDRNTRLRDIGEARIAIDRKPLLVAEETGKPITRTIWPWAAAAILGVAALAGWLRPARVNPESVILTIPAPPGEELSDVPMMSPDGLWVWYQSQSVRMYVRRIDSLEARVLPGRSGRPAFWSADSSAFFYWDSGLRRTQPKSGLQDVVLSDRSGGESAWSDSGTLLVARRDGKETVLAVTPSSGGEPKSHSFPRLFNDVMSLEYLPGGDDFIISGTAPENSGDPPVYLASLRDGKPVDAVLLFKNPTPSHYTPAGGGRLLYVHNDNLYSRKLNRRARRLEGDPELILEGVASRPPWDALFSVARNGTIAWRPGNAQLAQVEEFDRSGRLVGTSGPPGVYSAVVPASDGKRLLAYAFGQLGGAWLLDVGQPGKLDLPEADQWYGWSDGGSMLIGEKDGSVIGISAAGLAEVYKLGKAELNTTALPDISSDGKEIIFPTRSGVSSLELDANSHDSAPKPVVAGSEPIRIPSLSPDRHWIVYDAGRDGVYVRHVPGPGQRRRIGARGANISFPYWRKDGNEILFYNDGDLMSVAVTWHGGDPSFAEPRKLFSGLRRGPFSGVGGRPLAASRDGSRIYWLQGPDPAISNVIHIKTYAIR